MGPILRLLWVHHDGLCNLEPMASGMLPHAIGAVGHVPANRHSPHHGHAENVTTT